MRLSAALPRASSLIGEGQRRGNEEWVDGREVMGEDAPIFLLYHTYDEIMNKNSESGLCALILF